jgi:hypothetical protein
LKPETESDVIAGGLVGNSEDAPSDFDMIRHDLPAPEYAIPGEIIARTNRPRKGSGIDPILGPTRCTRRFVPREDANLPASFRLLDH